MRLEHLLSGDLDPTDPYLQDETKTKKVKEIESKPLFVATLYGVPADMPKTDKSEADEWEPT